MRRALFLLHRYIGIATCLFVAMWFSTGMVMMYVGYPGLTPAERLQGLEPLDLRSAHILPAQALATAEVAGWPQALGLEMVLGRPAYVIHPWDKAPRRTVFADDGSLLAQVTPAQAVAAACRFGRVPQARYLGHMPRDQWTVSNDLDALRPLHHVALDDPAGTEVYISDQTGAVVRDTTRFERTWNWVGAILHWLYFTSVRQDRWLWRQLVLWIAGVCIATTLTGIVIGLLRWRPLARYRKGTASPYHGMLRWHHILGLIAAVPLSTWIVSGWLSLTPGGWVSDDTLDRDTSERYLGIDAGSTAAFTAAPAVLAPLLAGAKEARVHFWDGQPVYILTATPTQSWRASATAAPMVLPPQATATVLPAARRLLPAARLLRVETLNAYDFYWYAHHTPRLLPVLRLVFDDPQQTWFHLDLRTGDVLEQMDASRRLNRIVFNALHSLDFPWLLAIRPVWDGVIIALCGLGCSLSLTAVVIAWRRLRPTSHVT